MQPKIPRRFGFEVEEMVYVAKHIERIVTCKILSIEKHPNAVKLQVCAITLDGVKGDSNPDMRSIEDIAVTEMNMDTARFPRYQQMVEQAEKYYQLVKLGKEKTLEARNVKKELDDIEALFSDDPAYVALLRAERNSQ